MMVWILSTIQAMEVVVMVSSLNLYENTSRVDTENVGPPAVTVTVGGVTVVVVGGGGGGEVGGGEDGESGDDQGGDF